MNTTDHVTTGTPGVPIDSTGTARLVVDEPATNLVEKLLHDALACLDCGKEHQLRDISQPGKVDGNGTPLGEFTWADPDDRHAYRHPQISDVWLRQWRADNLTGESA